MNCTRTEQSMSAYFDKELAPSVHSELRRHLEGCAKCARIVSQIHQLSRLASRLPDTTPPADLWDRIERELGQLRTSWRVRLVAAFRASAPTIWSTHSAARGAAIAATVLVLVIGGMLLGTFGLRDMEHRRVAGDFDRYLTEFHRDVDGAQQILMDSYGGRRVTDVREAARVVGYEPAAAKQIPVGYAVDEMNVLTTPRCACVEVTWRREAGGQLTIFEHADEKFISFGDRPSIAANCHGKAVRIVELGQWLAATWATGERQLTLIGVNDLDELLRLVLHFEGAS